MSEATRPGDEPVNIAPPQWQCPHCKRNYGGDFAVAQECAHAGPPDPAPEGVVVLILPSYISASERRGTGVFGTTTAGPVRAEVIDGARRHRRDLTVNRTTVDARELQSPDGPARPGDLVILGTSQPADESHRTARIGPTGYSLVDNLFEPKTSRPWASGPAPVWVPLGHEGTGAAWWRAPDEHERATLDMLTGGLLTQVAALDAGAYATRIEEAYRAGRHLARGLSAIALASPEAAIAVAVAHGAPNHIWALRWLSAHAAEIAAWQATSAIAWAQGTGGPIPATWGLRPLDGLPTNPGKKRLALMARYGTDSYTGAVRALSERLGTTPPAMPVPNRGAVIDELRTNRKEGTRAQ